MEEILNKKHETPYIICAAIWLHNNIQYLHQPKNIETGIVIAGRRHHNVFATLKSLGIPYRHIGDIEQGFITSDDRFVNRKEAGQIAFNAGQIDKLTECLFSEDLY